MPPNSNSRCVGDFSVVTPSNTTLYGFGDLSSRDMKPSRNLEFTSSVVVPEVKSTTQDLKITAANGLNVQSVNGSVAILAKNLTTTGSWSMGAQTGGSGALLAGSLGLALSTTTGGDLTLSAAARLVSNAGTTQLHASVGDATFSSSAGNFTSYAKLASTQVGDTHASINSLVVAAVQAPKVTLGTVNCVDLQVGSSTCTASKFLGQGITIGDASSLVTIPGSFVVTGTTTQVNTTQTTIADNVLVLNQAPSIQGRDSGLVLRRHNIDVSTGVEDATLVLSAGVTAGTLVLPVVSSTGMAPGWVLKISEGASSDVVNIVSIAGNIITFAPTITHAFTIAAVVKAYKTQSNTIHYCEAADEWRVGYSLDNGTGAQVSINKYAPLHCQNLVVETGFSSGSSSTVSVSIADNATLATGVQIPGLKSRGSYQLTIESLVTNGACASFFLSKGNSASVTGSVFQMTSSYGAQDESVWVEWPAGAAPTLYHDVPKTGAIGLALVYRVFFQTVGI